MTVADTGPSTGGSEEPLVDRVAAAALGVDGVTGLHAGSFGEVATYLPGRRVAGIRLTHEVAEVHLEVAMGTRVTDLADAVVAAVAPLVETPVRVFVEDVTVPVPAEEDGSP